MSSTWRVSPFGNLRIKSHLQIPEAYRSLSRPSSPPRAKASPVYSLLLSSDHAPFAQHVMLFCSCYDVSYLHLYCYSFRRAQTQQSPIVVCSSFLTSSNMSKNFLKVEGGGHKGRRYEPSASDLSAFDLNRWRITESNR